MLTSDDKDVLDIFNKLNVAYGLEERNTELLEEKKQWQFQLLAHFYYKPGQAEFTQEVTEYQVLRDFDAVVKFIQLKKLNLKYFYVKIITEENIPVVSDFIRDLDKNVLLNDLRWVLEYVTNPYGGGISPVIFSTGQKYRNIIEIRFTFTLLEDFFV